MDKDYEIETRAMYEAREACCEHCSKRYWEACTGITRSLGRVEGCKKVIEKYTERFNKWTNKIYRY